MYKGDTRYIEVDVTEPPEPMDIQWENVGFKLSGKQWLLYKCLAILLYAAIFVIIVLILAIQEKVKKDAKEESHKNDGQSNGLQNDVEEGKSETTSHSVQFIALVLSISISSSNGLLTAIFRIITKAEKHFTFSDYNFELAKRVSFGQYVNSA